MCKFSSKKKKLSFVNRIIAFWGNFSVLISNLVQFVELTVLTVFHLIVFKLAVDKLLTHFFLLFRYCRRAKAVFKELNQAPHVVELDERGLFCNLINVLDSSGKLPMIVNVPERFSDTVANLELLC